jgi:hypothetical protein
MNQVKCPAGVGFTFVVQMCLKRARHISFFLKRSNISQLLRHKKRE